MGQLLHASELAVAVEAVAEVFMAVDAAHRNESSGK